MGERDFFSVISIILGIIFLVYQWFTVVLDNFAMLLLSTMIVTSTISYSVNKKGLKLLTIMSLAITIKLVLFVIIDCLY